MTTPPPAPKVDPPAWDLPDRFRVIRVKVAKMDQAAFAKALGISRPAYQSYETGRHLPRDVVAMAQQIEALTGVPASWTLGLQDSTGTTPRTNAKKSNWCSNAGRRLAWRVVPQQRQLSPIGCRTSTRGISRRHREMPHDGSGSAPRRGRVGQLDVVPDPRPHGDVLPGGSPLLDRPCRRGR